VYLPAGGYNGDWGGDRVYECRAGLAIGAIIDLGNLSSKIFRKFEIDKKQL